MFLTIAATAPPLAPSAGETFPSFESLLGLALYVSLAVAVIGLLLFLSHWLGNKTRSTQKDQPYESGVRPTGLAKLHEPVPFYLVAIFFIVFDIEAIFIFSWAVAYDLLGWAGFLQITFFIVMLFLALAWLWRMGGLDWGPARPQRREGGREA